MIINMEDLRNQLKEFKAHLKDLGIQIDGIVISRESYGAICNSSPAISVGCAGADEIEILGMFIGGVRIYSIPEEKNEIRF